MYTKGSRLLAAMAATLLLMTSCKERPRADSEWVLFVPTKSRGENCQLAKLPETTPSGRIGIRLHSDGVARFAARKNSPAVSVKTGERYRISCWAQATQATTVEPGSPGILIRVTRFGAQHRDFEGGHIYISARGTAEGSADKLLGDGPPRKWSKYEAIIEIPPGVEEITPYLFCWFTSGDVYFDDPIIEKVSAAVPLTPLI